METPTDYILSLENASLPLYTNQQLTISTNGKLINSNKEELPRDTIIRGATIDNNAYLTVGSLDDSEVGKGVFLRKIDFQGNIVFERQYPFTPIDQIFSIGVSPIVVTEDAYFIVGRYVDADADFNPSFRFFAIKTDKEGNLINSNTFEVSDFITPTVYTIDSQDNIYASYQTTSRTGHILKLDRDGNLAWDKPIIGDLVSNRILSVELSNDEEELIVGGFRDPQAFVLRVDVTSGEFDAMVTPSKLFTPEDFTTSERWIQLIETKDGGVIVSYPYFSTLGLGSGIEYGKLDKAGNPLWSRRLQDKPYSNIRPILETADGGVLFQTINREDQLVLLKTDVTGSILPMLIIKSLASKN